MSIVIAFLVGVVCGGIGCYFFLKKNGATVAADLAKAKDLKL